MKILVSAARPFTFLSVALSVFLLGAAMARADFENFDGLVPDRRDSPAKNEKGFLAFPIYTHVPGIGSTFGGGFLRSKIFDTQANALAAVTVGDSSLVAGGITEVHVLSENLFFNFYGYATRIPFQLYDRGDGSAPDAFVNLMRVEYGATAEANCHYWNRRFQLNLMLAPSRLRTISATDADGTRFTNADGGESTTLDATARVQLDLTDDDQDPRQGVKAQLLYHRDDDHDALHSQYASLNAFLTGYVPMSSRSVWAFHVFRSAAFVSEQNGKSESEIRAALSLNCPSVADAGSRAKCLAAENRRVRERLVENRYGTSALLGGPTQLRGYPIGRFRGSQSLMYASEFRINVGGENVPFDYGFISGVRSVLQIAPFLEFGAATDPPATIETAPLHAAYGIGFRLGFSGTLLRADIGMSEEGPEFTVFFGYPWDLSIL